jgi:hypothetical protein
LNLEKNTQKNSIANINLSSNTQGEKGSKVPGANLSVNANKSTTNLNINNNDKIVNKIISNNGHNSNNHGHQNKAQNSINNNSLSTPQNNQVQLILGLKKKRNKYRRKKSVSAESK